MASKLKRIIRRASSKFLRRSFSTGAIEEDKASLFSAVPSLVRKIRLPNDPKKVRKAKHSSPPQHFPDSNAEQDEIRYFLYTLLTTKELGVYKLYPQWVLETCWAWTGNGRQLHRMSRKDLLNICPFSSGYAGIDPEKHKVEQMVPSAARQMIGNALLSFIDQQEGLSEIKQNEQQPLIGGTRITSMDSSRAPSVMTSLTSSTMPASTATSGIESQTERRMPRSVSLHNHVVHAAQSSNRTKTWYRRKQAMHNLKTDHRVPLPALKRSALTPDETYMPSYQPVDSCTSPSDAEASVRVGTTSPSPCGDTTSAKGNPDSPATSSPVYSLPPVDPKSSSVSDGLSRFQVSIAIDQKDQTQDSQKYQVQERPQYPPARYNRADGRAREEAQPMTGPDSNLGTGVPERAAHFKHEVYSTLHGVDFRPLCSTTYVTSRDPGETAPENGATSLKQKSRNELYSASAWPYQNHDDQVSMSSANLSCRYTSLRSPSSWSLPMQSAYLAPLQPIPESQSRNQGSAGNAVSSNHQITNNTPYPSTSSTHGLPQTRHILSTQSLPVTESASELIPCL